MLSLKFICWTSRAIGCSGDHSIQFSGGQISQQRGAASLTTGIDPSELQIIAACQIYPSLRAYCLFPGWYERMKFDAVDEVVINLRKVARLNLDYIRTDTSAAVCKCHANSQAATPWDDLKLLVQ